MIDVVSGVDILKSLSLNTEDEVYVKIDAESVKKEIVKNFLSSEYSSHIKEFYCEVHESISTFTNGVSFHYIQTTCNCNNACVTFKSWF